MAPLERMMAVIGRLVEGSIINLGNIINLDASLWEGSIRARPTKGRG